MGDKDAAFSIASTRTPASDLYPLAVVASEYAPDHAVRFAGFALSRALARRPSSSRLPQMGDRTVFMRPPAVLHVRDGPQYAPDRVLVRLALSLPAGRLRLHLPDESAAHFFERHLMM